jgi:glycosyltransferase involved in cell wall biosynthesis
LGHVKEKTVYQPYETAHVAEVMRLARQFDVLHDHTKVTGVLEARFCPTPVITTVHNDFTTERRLVYGAYPGHRYVAISQAHARRMPELNFVGTVYNGLDLAETVFREQKDDYLLFLGRLDAPKGAHLAARLAAELDLPLIMAGRKEPGFFEEQVAPYLDGKRRRFVGEVSGRPKWELYAGARALLFPIQWEEPFGLVMIEALACGTPVLATRRGSVPEILTPETGVVVPDADFEALLDGVDQAMRLDPRACRRSVEERFSADRMVEAYLEVYAREAGVLAA